MIYKRDTHRSYTTSETSFDDIVSIPDLAAEIDASTEEAQRIHEQNVAALEAMKSTQTVITTAQTEITPTKTGMYHLVKM